MESPEQQPPKSLNQTFTDAFTKSYTEVAKGETTEKSNATGWVSTCIGALLGTLLLYVLCTVFVTLAYLLHPRAAFFVSIVLFILACLSNIGFWKEREKERSRAIIHVIAVFIGAFVLALAGVASFAYCLDAPKTDVHPTFHSVVSGLIAFDSHFIWHLIDMIPGIKVWETLKIDDPIGKDDFQCRVCVLFLEIYVFVPFVGLFKSWMELRKGTPDAKSVKGGTSASA